MGIQFGWRVRAAVVAALAFVCGFGAGAGHARADEGPASQIVLRFDGVYQSEKQKDHFYYVRFYDDGTAITVTSSGTPADLGKWFDRKHDGVSRGTYVITGTRIVFSAASKEGKVDYDGTLNGEQIDLRSFSHINKHKGEAKYTFVKSGEK